MRPEPDTERAHPGLLLAFEGVDGSGKTTQIERLVEHARGHGIDARILREPGGTKLGEELRRVLLEGPGVEDALLAALLFMASRRRLVTAEIEPALARGELVILDRSFVSTWVYQGVVGGVDAELLERLTREVHGAALPELVLLLDLDATAARARRAARAGEADAIEKRGNDYMDRIGVAFREIAEARAPWIQRVDADASVDDVHARCLRVVEPHLEALAERVVR